MHLLIASFTAGALTVAAPCILPLLPVIVGGVALPGEQRRRDWKRPLIITGSLAVSVFIFSLLLKATTALLGVPQQVWSSISGLIVLLFGLNLLVPTFWERLAIASGLYSKSNDFLQTSTHKKGLARDILLGAALGPVFSSCSPTYALIVAVILPQSFARGTLYLAAYALGLAAVLLLIATAGQSITRRLGWLADPHGWFRRIVGILFIVVGLAVLTGLDRKFQTYVLDQGWYEPIMKLEDKLN